MSAAAAPAAAAAAAACCCTDRMTGAALAGRWRGLARGASSIRGRALSGRLLPPLGGRGRCRSAVLPAALARASSPLASMIPAACRGCGGECAACAERGLSLTSDGAKSVAMARVAAPLKAALE